MSAERERKLLVAQRRMLRWIVGVGRRCVPVDSSCSGSSSSASEPELEHSWGKEEEKEKIQSESWVDWIRRATGIVELHAERARVTDWIDGQRVRKWALAGHTARREDNRWATRLLQWFPQGCRSVGRPKVRWRDVLVKYVASAFAYGSGCCDRWKDVAQDRASWRLLQEDFVRKSWF